MTSGRHCILMIQILIHFPADTVNVTNEIQLPQIGDGKSEAIQGIIDCLRLVKLCYASSFSLFHLIIYYSAGRVN